MSLRNISLISIVLILFIQANVFAAVNAPVIKCIAINANGSLTLVWDTPADPNGEFVGYQLYYGPSLSGNFTLFAQPNNISINAQTDNSLNYNTGTYFFVSSTVWNDGVTTDTTFSTDTVRSMYLALAGFNTDQPILNWQKPFTNKPSSVSNFYKIYRRIKSQGVWTLIDSTSYNNTQYIDQVEGFCSDSVFYRIELNDQSGCKSISNVAGGNYQDVTPPDLPELKCISYNEFNDSLEITWSKSSDLSTGGYVIYYYNGVGVPRDTVYGYLNESFTSQGYNAFAVAVTAIDSCGVEAPPAAGHEVMQLSVVQNACARENLLSWTPYNGWIQDPINYQIYVSNDKVNYSVLTSTNGSTFSFLHTDIEPNIIYYYYVEAIDPAGICAPKSKVQEIQLLSNVQSDTIYLRNATIVNNSYVQLEAFIDTTDGINEYALERSLNPNGPFFEIQRIIGVNLPNYTFRDSTAKFHQASYYYRFGVYDTCSARLGYSNLARTIHLQQVKELSELEIQLNWNLYSDWTTNGFGVGNYSLYRSQDSVLNPTPIRVLKNFETNYLDDVEDLTLKAGEICYYIKAAEADTNLFGFKDTVRSNTVCAYIDGEIFIPSAFTPNGDFKNDYFLPVFKFLEEENYRMQIYNRWGELVFETLNVAEGWDGTLNGYMQQPGLYLYKIEVQTSTNKTLFREGNFLLLR